MKTLGLLIGLFFCSAFSFSQNPFNVGISPGLSISGIHNNQNQTFFVDINQHSSKRTVRPFLGMSLGLFGTYTFKNLSLKVSGIYHKSGTEFGIDNSVTQGSVETFRFERKDIFQLEYLLVPIQLEMHFQIKKIRPYLSFGIVPSFLFNIQRFQETKSGELTYFYDQDYLASIKDSPFIEDQFESPFIFGGGFNLSPHISVELLYFQSRKDVFCREVDGWEGTCGEHYRNKTIRISLNFRLKNQNFEPFWKKKKR